MKKITLFIMTAMFAAAFTACGGAANVAPANTAAAKPAPKAPPTKDALATLEKAAFEAYKAKNGEHFNKLLDANFVMLAPGQRMGKEAAVRMITENKCTIANYSFADERMTPAGPDAAVLTSKVTQDVTCEGKKEPANLVSSTVYLRRGDEWKVAFHTEVPVVTDAKTATKAPATAAPPSKPLAEEAEKVAANPKGVDAPTAPLLALHKAGAEAWMARDAKKLTDMTGSDLVFVDPMGTIHAAKADVIKAWTEPKCEIKSVDVGDATGVPLSDDASMLLSKLTATGTCEGQKLGALWGMGMYVKQGDAWKMVYLIEWPA